MATPQSPLDSRHNEQTGGPSGFIQYNDLTLVVDYGRIYMNDNQIGFLYEDGTLTETIDVLGDSPTPRPIEAIKGCHFRGIDSTGLALTLPGAKGGPTGNLSYNGIALQVINGRIASPEHKLAGEMDDAGNIYLRNSKEHLLKRALNEMTQLNSVFSGQKSTGETLKHDFTRPLFRKDKSYTENEIIRYFEDFDKLSTVEKKYVIDSMSLWSSCGLLQVVRKSEGNAMLGNVKHGAAGVTAVKAGYVTLDKEEFDKEITLFRRFGSLAVVATKIKPYLEVRINLVVAHEFGHQVQFALSQAAQDQIQDLYESRRKHSEKLYAPPPGYDGQAELIQPQDVKERLFVSGYARTSRHEYWSECLAAFSTKDGRQILKEIDEPIYRVLCDLVLQPVKLLRRVFHDTIIDLQASLRLGGELKEDLLDL